MGLLRLLLVLAAVSAGAPALAEPAPTIAPAPAWVEAAAIPAANPKLADKPLQSLLVAPQTRYGADGTVEYYMEWATAVQNPQGLTATGNIVLAWQPEQSDLIVHKVRLLRAGKPIDLLANGQQFTVLRRESNLESAMLDGVLTAVMQPEGLSVGDVVNVAYTIRTRPGAVAFRGENLLILSHGSPTRVASFREIWENGVETRWRADPAIGAPKLSKSRWGTELRIELRDAEGPEPPANAPARYRLPPGLEVSQYRDWNEIGRILAPLYTSARTLKADSPLKAEIARIAAASSDPKARAMGALRLVQDKIRYLALNMGEGGYVPAAADQTWSRKFGDCKGKTVTLLALLDGLGIEAEPVLISTGFGETLSERLPQVRVFDHVLVRARIDGRSYWLDGTRLGDRRIEDLASSGLGWGLPVTAQGAALEQLPLTPPEQPMMEAKIIYDASAGFDHPVAVTGEIAVRGDVAMVLRQAISQAGREALLEQTRRSFAEKRADEEVTSFDIKEDEASGAVLFSFTGKTNMNWARPSSGGGFRFRFSNDTFENNVELDREPGPYKDIPFALPL